MVVFATVADVERMLPWKFTAASSPTVGMVEDSLRRHSATVLSVLKSKGMDAPSEGSRGYYFCQLLVLYLTAAEILRYRSLETGDRQVLETATYYDTLAKDLLSRLENNPQSVAGS